MGEASRAKQLHVVVDDSMGVGASVFRALGAVKVNARATCCWSMGGVAHFLIVPDDVDEARKVLRRSGYKVTTENVVVVTISNKAGAFAEILERVSSAGVDATMAYVTAATKTKALVVLMTASDTKTIKAINR